MKLYARKTRPIIIPPPAPVQYFSTLSFFGPKATAKEKIAMPKQAMLAIVKNELKKL